MESEFIKMMEEIEEMLKILKGNTSLEEKIEDAFKQPAKISIEKDKDGESKISMKGERLAILVTLAGLENTVLEILNVPSELWELIKKDVETMEVK